jgi:hypothetical protein
MAISSSAQEPAAVATPTAAPKPPPHLTRPPNASAAANPPSKPPSNPYHQPPPPPPYVAPKRITDKFTRLSHKVFDVEKLRPNQGHTLSFLFHNNASKGIVLLVDHTGGGKSHTMRCAGVFLGGIILIVEPLLSLAADVYGKFKCGSNAYGATKLLNLPLR